MNRFSFCSNSGSEPRRRSMRGCGVLQRLDRQVDLAVFLDGDDLGRRLGPSTQVLLDVFT